MYLFRRLLVSSTLTLAWEEVVDWVLVLDVVEDNLVRKWVLRKLRGSLGLSLSASSGFTGPWKHDLDLNTDHSLLEEDVSDGLVDEDLSWVTSGDEETFLVLLALGSLLSELTRDDDLTTVSTSTLDDVGDDGLGAESDGNTRQELGLEVLGLGRGRESLVGDVSHGDGDLSLVVAESLLDEGDELTLELVWDVALLLVSGTGDLGVDVSDVVGGLDSAASITVLLEGLAQELVEFSIEHTVCDELLLLVDSSLLEFCHSRRFTISNN